MIIKIPQSNRFIQSGQGDTLGNVWSTRNIDFEVNKGKARPSKRCLVTSKSSDTNNPQTTPQAFAKATGNVGAVTTSRYWTVADDNSGNTRVFQTDTIGGDFDLDTNSSSLGGDPNESDLKVFNDKLYVASGVDLEARNDSVDTWSSASSTLTDYKKLLEVYADRLYIVDTAEQILSMNAAQTIAAVDASNTLNIAPDGNDELEISCIRAVSNGLWIGTIHKEGGRGEMFFWDGETANTPEARYKLDTAGAMSMVIKDDRPYVMGMNGVLYTFNGSYFQEVARLDLDERLLHRFDIASFNDRFIHPNGMITVRDEILFNINTRQDDNSDTTPIKSPSGVYAYNKDIGIYHKFALSPQDDSATLVDYGQIKLSEAGAMWSLYEDNNIDTMELQSDFFVGFSYLEDNSTVRSAVARNDKRGLSETLVTAGVIVFPEIYAEQARELWQKVFLRIKPMANSTDKIVVKHRTQTTAAFEPIITWVDTTSFTSTDSGFANVEVGWEFEGLQGDGGGFLAHVSSISEAGGTYTVTLDETITGATTKTGKCRMDNWIKTGEVTDQSQPFDVPAVTNADNNSSSKIQYKLYMVGDIELEEFISVSKTEGFYK